MTQGLLDLKRLYWNLRRFRTGHRKGQAPYGLLGLRLPEVSFGDFLKLTPDELREQLSGQDVAPWDSPQVGKSGGIVLVADRDHRRFPAGRPFARWPSPTRFTGWTGSGSATFLFPSTCDWRSDQDPIGPDSRPPKSGRMGYPRAVEESAAPAVAAGDDLRPFEPGIVDSAPTSRSHSWPKVDRDVQGG